MPPHQPSGPTSSPHPHHFPHPTLPAADPPPSLLSLPPRSHQPLADRPPAAPTHSPGPTMTASPRARRPRLAFLLLLSTAAFRLLLSTAASLKLRRRQAPPPRRLSSATHLTA